MVNSASQALAEFKSQRMGGLLSGFGSTAEAPTIASTSLSDSAGARMARSAPKRSSTAFLDQVRQQGQRFHNTALAGIQAKQQAQQAQQSQQMQAGRAAGYSLPSGAGGSGKMAARGRGRYGLQGGASAAFTALEGAYARAFGGGIPVVEGYRDYANQVKAWNNYQRGGPRAAKPGTSLHGSGIAIDLGGPIQQTGTKQHAWLRANASQFGWYWVGQRYGEPWHWEYRPEWAKR